MSKNTLFRLVCTLVGILGIWVYDYCCHHYPVHTIAGILMYWSLAVVSLCLIIGIGLMNIPKNKWYWY